MTCPLCDGAGGAMLWRNDYARLVSVDDADYPGFCRLIVNRHVSEMSDLPAAERDYVMRLVFAAEAVLRNQLQPDKINLASLGNMVPHVHWHLIPRYRDDRHFPNPIWGEAQRPSVARVLPGLAHLPSLLTQALDAEKLP